jgi:hypothetical protein
VNLRAAIFTILLSGMTRGLAGQFPAGSCVASTGYDSNTGLLWPYLNTEFLTNADSTSLKRLAERIVGSYSILIITSEGAGSGKRAVKGTLKVTAPASPDRPNFEVFLEVSKEGFLHQPLRAPRPNAAKLYWRGAYHAPDRLEFHETDPKLPVGTLVLDDPRPVYWVQEIDSTGAWSGRWISGGLAVIEGRTPAAMVYEMPMGYFCAWPLPRH